MRYWAVVGGDRIDIEFETFDGFRVEARIGKGTYGFEVVEVEPGIFWFLDDSRSVEVAVTPITAGYSVRIGGDQLHVRFADQRDQLSGPIPKAGKGVAEVRALMPGRIVEVLVDRGASVDQGQGLFVIEAMKMQNEIVAPQSGRIERLLVEPGKAVNASDLLATIGPEANRQRDS